MSERVDPPLLQRAKHLSRRCRHRKTHPPQTTSICKIISVASATNINEIGSKHPCLPRQVAREGSEKIGRTTSFSNRQPHEADGRFVQEVYGITSFSNNGTQGTSGKVVQEVYGITSFSNMTFLRSRMIASSRSIWNNKLLKLSTAGNCASRCSRSIWNNKLLKLRGTKRSSKVSSRSIWNNKLLKLLPRPRHDHNGSRSIWNNKLLKHWSVV